MNTFARAARFFVYFFPVVARLPVESNRTRTITLLMDLNVFILSSKFQICLPYFF